MGRKINDITGHKFGNICVMRQDKRSTYTRWLCSCERCGTMVSLRPNQISTYVCDCTREAYAPPISRGELYDLYVTKRYSIANISRETGFHRNTISKYINEYRLKQDRLKPRCLQDRDKKRTGPKPSKLIGKRFGMLKVTEYTGEVRHRAHFVRCICDCGSEITALSTDLYKLKTVSCGCTESLYGKSVIRQYLIDNNIQFIEDHQAGPHTFDFAVYKDNESKIFIEYDWNMYDKLGSEAVAKNRYCRENSIQLHRIRHRHRKTIEELLSNIFKHF